MRSLILLMPYLIFVFVPLATIALIYAGVVLVKSNKKQEEFLQNIEKSLSKITQDKNKK